MVNGDHTLSFLLPKTQLNEHSFDLAQVESILEYDNDKYRIKGLSQKTKRETPYKQIQADHIFFDIIDMYQYDTLTTGYKSISQCLSFALKDTGFTFTIVGSFGTVLLENFGDNNSLALFQDIINKFGAEYLINGNDIRIYSKIGIESDFQFRFKHNLKTFTQYVDGNSLSTYIKGYGKLDDKGNPIVTAEYTSPLASAYGIKHANPVRDERYTNQAELLKRLKEELKDTPEARFELEFVELKKNGYPAVSPGLGDDVFVIYEPLKIDIPTRILEIEDYPESNQSPKVTLANVKDTLVDAVFSRSKNILDKIWDENTGKLRYDVYDESVKRATEALNNSLTELEYPEGMGIIARDPDDPNRFVVFRSGGIGITVDGGQTFKEAITSDGVTTSLLTAGQIKTNNVQIIGNDDLFYWDGNKLIAINASDPNKYVQLNSNGLVVKKGLIEVEREDGYKTIIGGKLSHSFELQPEEPGGMSSSIVVEDRYWTTTSTEYGTLNRYTFSHEARYLKLQMDQKCQSGQYQSIVQIYDTSSGEILGSSSVKSTEVQTRYILIDLGVPDGSKKAIWLMLRSSSGSSKAYAKKVRMELTDYGD